MLKFLFLIHRYLGIGLGFIMLLWCLSGFVMMYKPYPELNQKEQLETLEALNFSRCCKQLDEEELGFQKYQSFQLMMLNTFPVVHLYSENGRFSIVSLDDGEILSDVTQDVAKEIATRFADQHNYPEPFLNGAIEKDQWSVYSSYNRHRPLYHFSVNDELGTQWYISSKSGEVVQITTREQRVWGYLGAVIHWLYPTILREKARLWNQTVVWLSVLGTFLTATGLYFGLKQFKVRKSGKRSPYKAWSLWHHYSGLVFGLLTLTWIVSGLFSMQPWGLFESSGLGSKANDLRGGLISIEEINASLVQLNYFDMDKEVVLLEGEKLQGELFLTSIGASLQQKRYTGQSLKEAPLSESNLKQLAALMLPSDGVKQAEIIYEEDNYYFSHHNEVSLPVFKVIANSEEQTIYYLSPINGNILRKVDSASKGFRWLHYGLHRLDFSRFTRARPFWDIMMWILLLGVTSGVLTGFVLGVKRVFRGFNLD